MRTSTTQFELMVSYMERHGDLSRPCNGPQGRVTNNNRWAELVTQQNADATGDTKNEEKWRKNDGEDPGSSPLIQVNERENEDWNVPGSSSQPPIFEPANQPPSPPATPPTPIQGTPRSPRTPRRRRHPRLPVGASPKRRTPAISQSALAREAFANSDREWREFNKEKFLKTTKSIKNA
ncbi:uncharacterized protein LOC123702458 isoform X2 [Colias croceus]|uniref:uncharacterized protein LOC123702458 isoform X2 n=1 Tax=Colias crocea TaxID=72248 RepID=UPI001E27B48C|nr:uncharacterized protein LOC123702458 isoform X2 [Colias croceus]